MNLVFKPVGILSGVLAGIVAKKAFEVLWGLIDDQERPEARHRNVQVGKLAAALALEGANFRVARGLADHGARRLFSILAGGWPGEEAPQAN